MNHYWVVENKFLAGEYPRNKDEESSQDKVDKLIALGVTAFIDLTHEEDGMKSYIHLVNNYRSRGISYQQFPIPDLSIPASETTTKEILDAIDHHIANGRMVYVHCWGGVGRTGVIVGRWLARHGFAGEEALSHLRKLWQQNPKSRLKRSPETPAQERYIAEWEEPV